MKYAKEVIDLMSSYPKRVFTMTQLINYVKNFYQVDRKTVNKGIHRVLMQLEESKIIIKIGETKRGSKSHYAWK